MNMVNFRSQSKLALEFELALDWARSEDELLSEVEEEKVLLYGMVLRWNQ